jgi:uncharacterized repeat protein (TIGR03803 family)
MIALFAGVVGCAFVLPVSAADAATYREKVLYSFNLKDGMSPQAAPVGVNGLLYGTTEGGGYGQGGAVFVLNPATGAETVFYPICLLKNCADGAYPTAAVINVNGTLYGTTSRGGAGSSCDEGCGTVFSLDHGAETVLHSFENDGADGNIPLAGVINVNGTLYGTTEFGCTGCGGDGCGTVFALDPNTGVETVLYSFCSRADCAEGAYPTGSLIAVNGTLYGTAPNGGIGPCEGLAKGCGTVFSLNPNTGVETVIYSFCSQQNCADGASPTTSLIAANGKLYGTTYKGGANTICGSPIGRGAVFSLDLNSGAERVALFLLRPDGTRMHGWLQSHWRCDPR